MKFEYKIVNVNSFSDVEESTNDLNNHGDDGWELIEIFEERTSSSSELFAFFKKEK